MFVALVWFSEVSWFIIGLRWSLKAWGWIPICFGRFGDLLNFIKVVVSFVYVELIRQYIQEPPNSVSFFTYVHISNKTIFPVFFSEHMFFLAGVPTLHKLLKSLVVGPKYSSILIV